jgi:uncharacterized protein YjbI with pentapeptide repeats
MSLRLDGMDFGVLCTSGGRMNKKAYGPFTIEGLMVADMDLSDSDFKGVHFMECDFSEVDMSGCTFEDCSFTDCELEGVNLSFADLDTVAISNSRCEGMSLDAANLTDVTFFELTCRLSFDTASFTRGSFVYCDLWETDFSSASLKATAFYECDLAEAKFDEGSHLYNVTFQKCNVTGTRLVQVDGAHTCEFNDVRVEPLRRKRKLQTTKFPLAGSAVEYVDGGFRNYQAKRVVPRRNKKAFMSCSHLEEYKATR